MTGQRLLTVCLAVLAVTAACSSGEPESTVAASTTAAPAAAEGPSAEAVAATVVAQIEDQGGDGDAAVDAVFYAMERGYTIDQLLSIDAVTVIRRDGIIESDGTTEPPQGDPLGLVVLPADGEALTAGALRAGFQVQHVAAELRQGLALAIGEQLDAKSLLVTLIILMQISGYGPDQIIEAIVLGGVIVFAVEECSTLQIGDELVVPKRRAAFDCDVRIAIEAERRAAATSTTAAGTTTSAATVGSAVLVAVGPVPLAEDPGGEVTANEWRAEGCEDGRFLLSGEIVVIGDVPVTFATTAEGTWDAEAGTATATLTVVVSAPGEESETASSAVQIQITPAEVLVSGAGDVIVLPVVPGEPAQLCS